MDMKLEVVILPVADVNRAKNFYVGLGWRFDGDFDLGNGERVVQMTPPGSHCSILFGSGVTTAAPGSIKSSLYLAVSDLEAARKELISKGAKVGEIYHGLSKGTHASGPDPEKRSYFSFSSFSDPDGNVWVLQEVTTRLPGRADGETEFHSDTELADALKRAAAAHGKHEEKMGGKRDENWPAWYAKYLVQEQSGGRLPS